MLGGVDFTKYALSALNAIYWYQIFALYSAVVEVQDMFSSHGKTLGGVDFTKYALSAILQTPYS